MLKFVLLQGLGVNAVLVDDASIPLGHSNTRGSGTCEVATRVQSNVTKSLDNVGLASPAWSVANHGHVLGLVDEVLKSMEDASTSGTGPAMDTSLVDWLAWKSVLFEKEMPLAGVVVTRDTIISNFTVTPGPMTQLIPSYGHMASCIISWK